MLQKSLYIDPRGKDISAVVDKLIDDAPWETYYGQILEVLQHKRNYENLARLVALMPSRRGMAYDPKSIVRRASRRLSKAHSLYKNHGHGNLDRVLELGCARTENSAGSVELGIKSYIGLDIDRRLFPAQRPEHHHLLQGSAQAIPLADDSVDLAISFNVFEHLPSPQAALHEILRVLRPGGVFHTNFGPPFNSATGPHLTRYVDLPYMHHLYPEDAVGKLTKRADPYYTVNRETLGYYRDLFFAEAGFKLPYYREQINGRGFWLLKALPELRQALPVEELVVCAISAVVVKT